MIELRADGTKRGPAKLGRIYVLVNDGKLRYVLGEVEREEDWYAQIEKYPNFRGFVSEFLPLAAAKAELKALEKRGFTPSWSAAEEVLYLKEVFLKAHQAAEKAAHAYFAACPVGPERVRASEVYENVRNATRV